MKLFIKTENENGELEFYRDDEGNLLVSILNGHGTTYYLMNEMEIKCLVDYIKLTDERLD
jgi:hypothetical protein